MEKRNVFVLAIVFSASALAQVPECASTAAGQVFNDSGTPRTSVDGCVPRKYDCLQPSSQAADGTEGISSSWIGKWLRAVDQARANQPHFVSPLVTTHVMLVQQYRYDIGWQRGLTAGSGSTSYGSSRGLEIIPMSRLEIGLFPPSYVARRSNTASGFGDVSLQMKYRLFSGTEGKGDYFVGLFFAASLPSGSTPNGIGHAILSPTIAVAKGFSPWDLQSTIGGTLPASGSNVLGRSVVVNTALDYRIKGKVWPMVEQNSTFWHGGLLDGKHQTFITPGVVIGGFPVERRLHFSVGAGYQIAVTAFHQYDHLWVLSLRFPF
jgi:Putative MetA-pathway of phenol degradation